MERMNKNWCVRNGRSKGAVDERVRRERCWALRTPNHRATAAAAAAAAGGSLKPALDYVRYYYLTLQPLENFFFLLPRDKLSRARPYFMYGPCTAAVVGKWNENKNRRT